MSDMPLDGLIPNWIGILVYLLFIVIVAFPIIFIIKDKRANKIYDRHDLGLLIKKRMEKKYRLSIK